MGLLNIPVDLKKQLLYRELLFSNIIVYIFPVHFSSVRYIDHS